ncbi:hypothetical protein FSB08_28290 [Paraburkholderia sp. JPY432]|uniref:hypothetical protein n=1 Tax=Paraburkholderia youngii TaxID=2782701 RepID=UPI001595002E|nr:hypothetical protein [Paraburkholderia youngii]NVH76325.1 hypothetical protein [Paraburkholderia youngii]
MEIVEISVEFPSGMVITDRATLSRELGQVFASERLAALLRQFSATEAPRTIIVRIDGKEAVLDQRVDGSFSVEVPDVSDAALKDESRLMPVRFGRAWSKDQRQQFGRFCHSLTVASLAGFVGYWHSTTDWTSTAVLNEAALAAIIVLTFVVGMDSMNGE